MVTKQASTKKLNQQKNEEISKQTKIIVYHKTEEQNNVVDEANNKINGEPYTEEAKLQLDEIRKEVEVRQKEDVVSQEPKTNISVNIQKTSEKANGETVAVVETQNVTSGAFTETDNNGVAVDEDSGKGTALIVKFFIL